MNKTLITCPMCGNRFDPSGHNACPSCPLQKGCQLVCCPSCGYETVDPSQSSLARLALRLLGKNNNPSREDKGMNV